MTRLATPLRTVPASGLDELIRRAREHVARMTPRERGIMIRVQAASFVRAEAGFGSDADEAEYSAALLDGDREKIADCERRSRERVARVDGILREKGRA